jgi:Uncharacterized conserved protein (DUF2190)
MGEVLALYDPGADITCQISGGAVVGGDLVKITGRNPGGATGISDSGDGLLIVAPTAAAADYAFGVASFDAPVGGRTNVMRAPKAVPVNCTGAVAVGEMIAAGAAGKGAKAATGNKPVGVALTAVSAAGGQVIVALFNQGPVA